MHTLIVNGSPHKNGSTAALTDLLRRQLPCECTELFLREQALSPCVDCRACQTQNRCVIPDDFAKILAAMQSADAVVFASPVWFCTLSVPMLTLISRFQCLWAAQASGVYTPPAKKNGAILLTAGNGSPKNKTAFIPAREALRLLGVDHPAEVLCPDTDTRPVRENIQAAEQIRQAAEFLTSDKPNPPPSGMI